MINMIAAISKNHQIGVNNELPWHIPEDLKYFRSTTSGQTVLMGRKTFESIGRPLPKRRNIVLTRDPNFTYEGIEVVHTVDEALTMINETPGAFIIGGGEIYKLFLPYTDKLYLTLVDKVIDGDTTFPDFEEDFICSVATPGKEQAEDGTSYTFTEWIRK